MRMFAWVFPILLVSTACDKDEQKKALVDSVSGDAAKPMASAPSAGDAGAPPKKEVAMPDRPVPKPQTMVSSGMSEEVQMKAISYMVAMRAPHPDDAPADEAYATELAAKLRPILLAMDKGGDKAKWNRVDVIGGGRQIDLLMSDGCDAKAPFNAVTARANIPLSTLLSHGVLVVRCNDTKHQCLQSVRDPEDVLCTTAPRHK
jgi:hypothetical protein